VSSTARAETIRGPLVVQGGLSQCGRRPTGIEDPLIPVAARDRQRDATSHKDPELVRGIALRVEDFIRLVVTLLCLISELKERVATHAP
jgi:hypothetical protein